jgi:hypothetical protein
MVLNGLRESRQAPQRRRVVPGDEAHDRRGQGAAVVAFQTPPQRHWRSYGTDPLPTPAEAMSEPFRAFPSWFLRIECDRCGKVQMVNEAHANGRRREISLRALLARMRHDGCGGLAGKAELLSGIGGVSSRPVRKIVLRDA